MPRTMDPPGSWLNFVAAWSKVMSRDLVSPKLLLTGSTQRQGGRTIASITGGLTSGPTSCTAAHRASVIAWAQTPAVPHSRARGLGSLSTAPMNRLRDGQQQGEPFAAAASAKPRRSGQVCSRCFWQVPSPGSQIS